MNPFYLQFNESKSDLRVYQMSLNNLEQQISLLVSDNKQLKESLYKLEIRNASMNGRDKIIGFALGAFVVAVIQILTPMIVRNNNAITKPTSSLLELNVRRPSLTSKNIRDRDS